MMMAYLKSISTLYPHTRLLEKGYERFVTLEGGQCVPKDCYVSMFNRRHELVKQQEEKLYRDRWQVIHSARTRRSHSFDHF